MTHAWEPIRERLQRLGAATQAAEDHAAALRESRDAVIEEADLAGMPAQEIAREVGLGRTRIIALTAAQTAKRQQRLRDATGMTAGPLDVGAGG